MSVYARINQKDYHIISGSLKEELDSIPTIDFEVLAADIYAEVKAGTLRQADVQIFNRGSLLISGFVNDSPEMTIQADRSLTVKLGCFGELGRLTCYRAYIDAHFQHVTVVNIISTLLALMTGGAWAVGDTSTMAVPGVSTTVDLRSKETLFAQIKEAASATPSVHIRYGGMNGLGQHLLDIGEFNVFRDTYEEGFNLVNVSLRRNEDRVYRIVEAYGERSSDERIDLELASTYPDYLAHPDAVDFPISQDPVTGSWIVTNANEPVGCDTTKRFDVNKTKNDVEPTDAHKQEASYGVWLNAVRFLKSRIDYVNYTVNTYLKSSPTMGDRARLVGHVDEIVFDHLCRKEERVRTFEERGEFKVVRAGMEFGRGVVGRNTIPDYCKVDETYDLWEVEITSNDDVVLDDPELELYERLERHDTHDLTHSTFGTHADPPVIVTLDDTIEIADCFIAGVIDAKLYIFPAPTPPATAVAVNVNYNAVTPPNVRLEVILYPASPGDDLILCVAPQSVPWGSFGGPITLQAQYTYS